ncbi:hypothetical protein V8E55_009724 [Tylopilus felleus]
MAFHVSVCGGGIGGLTLALVIGKYSALPISEAGPTITTVGARISFFRRTMDIMKKMELYDELIKMAIGPPGENTGKIILHFSDGSSTLTDVLVGPDGIRSATRKTMYRNLASSTQDDDSRKRLLECIDPVWTGMLVYRNLIPTVKLLKEYPDV